MGPSQGILRKKLGGIWHVASAHKKRAAPETNDLFSKKDNTGVELE